MENNQKDFYIGAMWAASTMWRMHTDSVVVKDLLNEMPDAHEIAKFCPEYDLQPLRLNVMGSLPLGVDADYKSIEIGLINSIGDLVCDLSKAGGVAEKDYESFGLYAVEKDGSFKVLVTGFYDSVEEADGLAEILREQLQSIQAERLKA